MDELRDAAPSSGPSSEGIKPLDPNNPKEIRAGFDAQLTAHADGGVRDEDVDKTANDLSANILQHNQAKANDHLRIVSQQSELRSAHKDNAAYFAQDETSNFAREQTLELTQRKFDSGGIVDRSKQNLMELASTQSVTHRASASLAGEGWGRNYSDVLADKPVEGTEAAEKTSEPESLESIGQEITEEIVEKENQAREATGGEVSAQSEDPTVATEKPDEKQSIQDESSSEKQNLDSTPSELHNGDPEQNKVVEDMVQWRQEPSPSPLAAKTEKESVNTQVMEVSPQVPDGGSEQASPETPKIDEIEQKPEAVVATESATQEEVLASNFGKVLEDISKQIGGEAGKAGDEVVSQIGLGETTAPPPIVQPEPVPTPLASDVLHNTPPVPEETALSDQHAESTDTPAGASTVETSMPGNAAVPTIQEIVGTAQVATSLETADAGNTDLSRTMEELEKAKATAAAVINQSQGNMSAGQAPVDTPKQAAVIPPTEQVKPSLPKKPWWKAFFSGSEN